MKKVLQIPAVLAAFVVISAGPALGQPQRGLSGALGQVLAVVCAEDPSFDFTPGEEIVLAGGRAVVHADADDDTGFVSSDGDAIRALTVTITHGTTTSRHVILYEDNGDDQKLDCADTIVGVS